VNPQGNLAQRPNDPLTARHALPMLASMTLTRDELPDDIERLKALLLAERRETARLQDQNERSSTCCAS